MCRCACAAGPPLGVAGSPDGPLTSPLLRPACSPVLAAPAIAAAAALTYIGREAAAGRALGPGSRPARRPASCAARTGRCWAARDAAWAGPAPSGPAPPGGGRTQGPRKCQTPSGRFLFLLLRVAGGNETGLGSRGSGSLPWTSRDLLGETRFLLHLCTFIERPPTPVGMEAMTPMKRPPPIWMAAMNEWCWLHGIHLDSFLLHTQAPHWLILLSFNVLQQM